MTKRNAYILMGLGAVLLLTQMGGGIWIALVAAVLLALYVQRKSYGLLVAGSVAMGLAIGNVLELRWGWDGALLVSLGIGLLVVNRLEPRENQWPRLAGRVLIGLGFFVGLLGSGFVGPAFIALALFGIGFYLLRRNQTGQSNPWVEVGLSQSKSSEPQPVATDPVADKSADAEPTGTDPTDTKPVNAKDTNVDTSLDLDDPEAVTMKTAAASKAANKTENAPATTAEPVAQTSSSNYDEALYAALETWRRDIAKSEERKAYLILTNASLKQIAQDKPQTLETLKDIKGIGPVKLGRYGEAIVSLVNEHS